MKKSTASASKYQDPSNKTLTVLLALGYALAVAAWGWFWFEVRQVRAEIEITHSSINNLEELTTESDEHYGLDSATAVEKALANQVQWSEAMRKVLALEDNEIVFQSFSVSRAGDVSVQGLAADIVSVKRLLTALEESDKIYRPFVANVQANYNRGSRFGQSFVLTFSFTSEL